MKQKRDYFDLRILKRFQEGDQAAFDEIYEFYKKHIYYLGFQYFHDENSALDVVQNTFMIVCKDIEKLQSLEAFFVWMERIAYRCCLQMSRKKKQDAIAYVNEYDESYVEEAFSYDNKTGNITKIQQNEANQIILKTLNEMNEDFKIVGFLRFFEELDLKDIAHILDVPIGTVMSRIARIKKKLKEELERQHFTKENCLCILVIPNMIGIYTEFAQSIQPMSEVSSQEILKELHEEEKTTKTKDKKSSQLPAIALILSSIMLSLGATGYRFMNSPQFSNLKESAQFKSIEYQKELTNKPILVNVETTNDDYDEILLNDQSDLSIKKNDTYKLSLLKGNKVIDTRFLEITNIDIDIPVVLDRTIKDDSILFKLNDMGSGLNFNKVMFYEDGINSTNFTINEDASTIEIIRDVKRDSLLQVSDYAGNILEIKINSYKLLNDNKKSVSLLVGNHRRIRL